ncbi:MAG TPA: glycosyltransferase [Thermoanaerobaculia bacterium]|nr:glycosyltransferase [Thermoanaerobaculia bacterium]
MAETLDVQVETTTAAPAASASGPRVRTAIAVIVTHFPRIDETFILREINELERNGQPVVVVPLVRVFPRVIHEEAKPWMKRALFTPLLDLAILRSNVRAFFRAPLQYLRILLTIVLHTLWSPSTLVRSVALFPKAVHLAQTLTGMGVRHVHAHFATHAATVAWIMASISDITYSFTVHGPDVFVHRPLLREKIEKAKFVRCTSTFNKAFLSGLYPLLTQGKLEVIHTGVNPDVYAEASRAAKKKPSLQLLSVAALTPSRGFPVLIDACARLIQAGFDLECNIVGDGRLRLVTEQWIARHGLDQRVHLLGALPQHEVARLMGEADIFVFPSIIAVDGQMDGIPIALMEAMAAGKPVVASAISGIPELVRHEVSGLLVDAAYPQRMEATVRRLIEDPALRQRLGEAGRQTVLARFDVRRTTQSLIAFLDGTSEVNQPTQTTKERIRALNWKRLNAVGVGVRRVHDRPDSYVAEVTISDGVAKQDVIVRQHCGPTLAEAQARARNEFETLSTLQQSIPQDARWTMPRLLMFDEPNAALVVERADGKSLAGILAEGGGRVAQALRQTAMWLRFLQEKTRGSREDRRYLVTGVVLLALHDLELALAGDPVLARRCSRITERLRELEGPVAELPQQVTGTHGNFIPENIFIGSRHVVVVDFGSYREGLPLEDVAELLLHLELRGAGAHRRAFLDGYRSEIDPRALELFTVTRALHWLARRGVTRAERRKLRTIILRSVG